MRNSSLFFSCEGLARETSGIQQSMDPVNCQEEKDTALEEGKDDQRSKVEELGSPSSAEEPSGPAEDGHQIGYETMDELEVTVPSATGHAGVEYVTTATGVEYVSTATGVEYVPYESELQMPDIMRLMKADLSEPYSIYTYRYFIHNWPNLCILAQCDGKFVGAIVCKLEMHHYNTRRGYIAMLAVDKGYRKRKIGSTLVKKSIRQMVADGCDEIVLETEVTNQAALSLYENLGFVRDKYLHQYYLNGVDAYRLKLWLKDPLSE